jgi:predicted  nucleic acid-binding Zn-ribbon protein
MNSPSTTPSGGKPIVEVSWGELIDKMTILEIKEQRLTSPKATANVRRELTILITIVQGLQPRPVELDQLKRKIRTINETLWEIEDKIRAKEAKKSFDQEFIELARSIYINNDKRAQIKSEINRLLNSDLVEEKEYTRYGE